MIIMKNLKMLTDQVLIGEFGKVGNLYIGSQVLIILFFKLFLHFH